MTPPQAPPAIEAPANQATVAAFNRLVSTRDWLAGQFEPLRSVPTATPTHAGHATFLARFDEHWSPSRRAELAGRIALAMGELAQLGQDDGTLDARSVGMAREVSKLPAGPTPSRVAVRELMFGAVVLAGSLIVETPADPGTVLLFSANGGWESFADLAALHESVEHRVRRHLGEGGTLPGAGRRALGRVGTDGITSQPMAGAALASYVDRAIAVHREKLDEAWEAWAVVDSSSERDVVLADTLTALLDWLPALDVESLLAARHARVVEATNEERLSQVPNDVANRWREAADQYAEALDAAAMHGMPVKTLAEFAADTVSARLTALGVTAAPDEIVITADYNGDVAARAHSLPALFEGTAPVRFRLLDLVYQNIASFDPVHLTAHDGGGSAIAALDDHALRTLVRDLDLATRYDGYLTGVFRTGDSAGERKRATTLALAMRMRLQAADARLSYHWPGEPRSFRDDHAERSYQWVSAVLDAAAPAARRKVEGHEVTVRQVTYKGTPLKDVLVFGVRQERAVPTVVYYTPDAPDGIVFREFADRADAARAFLYHPAFREYLLDRLPMEYADAIPGRSERKFAGTRLANWALGSPDSAGYTWTDEAFDERTIDGDFLDATYEVGIQLALRNVTAFSRSASDANWALLVDWPRRLLLDNVLANAIKGIANAPAHAAQASWRLYDSIKAGDTTQAYLDFTDFYVASLGAAAPGVIAGTARGVVAANFRQGIRLVGGAQVKPAPTRFEARYEATGLGRQGPARADGTFSIGGERFVHQNGKLYAARYDATFDTWRLKPHGSSDRAWGPAVRFDNNTGWTYHPVGLRGGSGRGDGVASAPHSELFNHYSDALERAFPDVFERDVVLAAMRAEAAGESIPWPVTSIQRARWTEAALNARTAERVAQGRSTRPRRGQAGNEPSRPPQAEPSRLVVPRTTDPLPSMFRRVDPVDAPPTLYYYGTLPFRDSALQRELTLGGYRTGLGELHGTYLSQNLVAVRVTTVPPSASIHQIHGGMGTTALARWKTFAVRIDSRSILQPAPSGPRTELLVVEGALGREYYLRPLTGENFVRLGAGFDVLQLRDLR